MNNENKKHLKTVNLEEPETQNSLYLLIHYYTTSETKKKLINYNEKMIYKCKQNVCYVSICPNSKSDGRLATHDCHRMDLSVTCSLRRSRDVLFFLLR